LWLVKLPLSGASYAIWNSPLGVPISSLMYMYLLSLYSGLIFMIIRIYVTTKLGDDK
jgi:hypothetical protein